jgi:S-disulfanyl-L-cysteine oxidoreductase SoxD
VKKSIAAGISLIVCGVAAPAFLARAAQSDAAPTTTQSGVYTADQAQQGKALYTSTACAACHGPSLQGAGQNPPLAGKDFLTNWTDQTVADLFSKIQTTMPATKPGSLKPEETAQIVAYILSANKFPAGTTALPDDSGKLKEIKIK